jgi:hypothetical protein
MHPLEGSCQEAILFPTPPLTPSFRGVPLGTLHSRPGLPTPPGFLGVVSTVWAPHQPPLRLTAPGRLAGQPHGCPWPLLCPRTPSVPCRVQWAPAHTCPGALPGPVASGRTAEASPDSTIRWEALSHGLRSGRITRRVVPPIASPSPPSTPPQARPQPHAGWTSQGSKSRMLS